VVSVNRNIVRYNKYIVVVTVVVVFVSYCYSYCDFVRKILQSLLVCSSSSSSTLCILFLEKSLIVLGLFHYKYWSEYLLCGRLQWERTAVESLNFLTLWPVPYRQRRIQTERAIEYLGRWDTRDCRWLYVLLGSSEQRFLWNNDDNLSKLTYKHTFNDQFSRRTRVGWLLPWPRVVIGTKFLCSQMPLLMSTRGSLTQPQPFYSHSLRTLFPF